VDWTFVSTLLNVIVINLVLSGDNAVAIAMAARSLPKEQRAKGMIFGAGGAVLLLVPFTFFVSQLLSIHFVRLAGGMMITWIAVKLLMEEVSEEACGKEVVSVFEAVKVIIVANITMSLDNVLAVAAASHGHLSLLIFGLGLSIPVVLFASNLLATLMNKYPFISYIGAAILGRVGGEMMVTDPFIVDKLAPGAVAQYTLEALFAVGVIAIAVCWSKGISWREKAGLLRCEAQAIIAEPDRKL
jgi:YjbE family integral membrane protein